MLASVHPTDVMPDRHGEAAAHRKALLDLCLPKRDVTSVKRRACIDLLLPGDFASDVIIWYVPNMQMFNVGLWAKNVARVLFPGRIPPILRQRWANALLSQCEYTLLSNVHNILGRAGPRWLQRISGEKVQDPRQLSAVLDGATPECRREPLGWEFNDSDSNAETPQEALVELDPHVLEHATGASAERDAVSEFNKNQKGRARAFICSNPQHRLVIALLCLGVAVTFLHSVEHIASQQWENRCWSKCVKDPLVPPPSRMVEAAKGTFVDKARKQAVGLLLDENRWKALKPPGRTLGSADLGFIMLSTFWCSIDQILLRFWRNWPYRVFLLLCPELFDQVAKDLLSSAECALDEFTRRFRKMFPTLNRLKSLACMTVLKTLSVCCRFDITRIECRNALLRRLARQYDTWSPDMGRVSSQALLRRQRQLERPATRAKRPGRSAKCKTKFRTCCFCLLPVVERQIGILRFKI